jgi:hypothetical protein
MSRLRLLARAFGATVVSMLYEVGNIPRPYWVTMAAIATVGDAILLVVTK